MTKLMKCPKCGAVMIKEDYLQYGWYLDGQRVEGCPAGTEPNKGKAAGLEEHPGRLSRRGHGRRV